MKKSAIFSLILVVAISAAAQRTDTDPTLTRYTAVQCQGTYMPYPEITDRPGLPDSLEAVMISHIGRHGARYASSPKKLDNVEQALRNAESQVTITQLGREMLQLCNTIRTNTAGRWGALNRLGEQEQAGIATRLAQTFPKLLENGRVAAIADYSPRCIMSMYEFCHQLSRMNNRINTTTSSGRQNSALIRPFDDDPLYQEYRAGNSWSQALDTLTQQLVDPRVTAGFLGTDYTYESPEQALNLAIDLFEVASWCQAMELQLSLDVMFTERQRNDLWAVTNLRHYLQYSSSTLTTVTAEMAAPLLLSIINDIEDAAAGTNRTTLNLRFGHAETLMPLMALMRMRGGYYMTNYWDTVGMHWRDFELVPMAANMQFIVARHKKNGRCYVRLDLNEEPILLIVGNETVWTPAEQAVSYLVRCLPLIYQP